MEYVLYDIGSEITKTYNNDNGFKHFFFVF